MDHIQLNWRGPYEFERAREVDAANERGIYAITVARGSSPERFIRIGQAYDRSFWERLSGYTTMVDAISGTCFVRFGIFDANVSRISRERLDDVERLLIYVYQPQANREGVKEYKRRRLELTNSGRHGPIDRIIRSTDYE